MRKTAVVVVLAVALCLASAAVAQTVIETKVKSGTVIGKTDHSVVIKMDDGVVREFEVPPGRTATVDGKEVGLAGLKIGTTLSATFNTIDEARRGEDGHHQGRRSRQGGRRRTSRRRRRTASITTSCRRASSSSSTARKRASKTSGPA